ncbi:aminodeoxychorismate/anthranilate synthase component II [Solitalea sp. MAHUQ-68]|uniref:Aminodeoxychorismate/anthranilate synthase component II n=1 Tax=Solitalea agri TaxID=2953739 RepID=A0A9X2JGE1_9SPHI|nr:aminodeoxychorismate/anthranilate synthase component II [Solitalea agri]MCO4294341.1 aminodeoxychorismate/anthranilate synthase component II [Solitalea agri]
MKILILDNYDSFTYNLVHLVEEIGIGEVSVFRNDKISLEDVNQYDKIILSPGPGLPEEAGIMPQLIKTYAGKKSILGVCLGHQAIGEAFGAKLFNLSRVLHGIASPVKITDSNELIFKNVPQGVNIGHYHSWAVATEGLPAELEVTAVSEDGTIMAMRHRDFDIRGVQFHPESVLTEHGRTMLENWIKN